MGEPVQIDDPDDDYCAVCNGYGWRHGCFDDDGCEDFYPPDLCVNALPCSVCNVEARA